MRRLWHSLRRLRHSLVSWWRAHRGEIAAAVTAGLLLAVVLGAFHVIPVPGLGGGEHDHPVVQTTPPPTNAPGPVITSVTLPAEVQRDPPGHELRNIDAESSAEFFDGELVVSVGRIRSDGQGDYSISRLVFRAASGGHCELPGVGVGGAWELIAESGRHYRVDLRGIAQNFAGVVAYTDPTRVVTPGPSHCLLLLPKALP